MNILSFCRRSSQVPSSSIKGNGYLLHLSGCTDSEIFRYFLTVFPDSFPYFHIKKHHSNIQTSVKCDNCDAYGCLYVMLLCQQPRLSLTLLKFFISFLFFFFVFLLCFFQFMMLKSKSQSNLIPLFGSMFSPLCFCQIC